MEPDEIPAGWIVKDYQDFETQNGCYRLTHGHVQGISQTHRPGHFAKTLISYILIKYHSAAAVGAVTGSLAVNISNSRLSQVLTRNLAIVSGARTVQHVRPCIVLDSHRTNPRRLPLK